MSETVLDAAGGIESTTFHATLPAERLLTALDPVAALVEECRVRFDEAGLRVAATDPATVALVDVRVGADAFGTYRTDSGRFGLDLERFLDVVGVGDRDDVVEMVLDPETRRLRVAIDDLSYSLALLDPDSVREPPDPDDMEYDLPAAASLRAERLDRGVGAAEMVGDHVAVGVETEDPAVVVRAEGDTDEASLRLPAADLDRFEGADVTSLFSLSYLDSMCRAMPSETTVDLDVGTEAPLSLSFDPTEGVSVDYLLAPRRRADYGE